MPHYDVIVLGGAGGIGTAALYQLARRGARVLGLDRFPPGHDRGSSHGQSRIIRMAYHEHPNYVPLVRRAYELWRELEAASERPLLDEVGLLVAGLAQGEIVSGVQRSAAQHSLPVETLSAGEVRRRFPGYRVPDDFVMLFERQAGYLLVEECIKAHARAAEAAGAELRSGVTVHEWRIDGSNAVVVTDQGTMTADRLVVTAGAWASELLASLAVPFKVIRKPVFWYRTAEKAYRRDTGCPCFLFETLGGFFYGFPQIDERGVKVAEHTGGEFVPDPLDVDRGLHQVEQRRIEDFLTTHLPGVSRECAAHSVCMYTTSPDGHFVVGRHPQHEQVVFTAGLSGHGFKFAPVLGEVMAELALDGTTRHAIEFLSPRRFYGNSHE